MEHFIKNMNNKIMGLLDELTDKDLRDLAALVGPYWKESSFDASNVPSAGSSSKASARFWRCSFLKSV